MVNWRSQVNKFMSELNEYICLGGNGHARFKNPFEMFYSKRSYGLMRFLSNDIGKGKVTKESARLILSEALPGVYLGHCF